MFATASRSRRHGSAAARSSASASSQESSDPPAAGCDSCFDVRSLNGSEVWEPSRGVQGDLAAPHSHDNGPTDAISDTADPVQESTVQDSVQEAAEGSVCPETIDILPEASLDKSSGTESSASLPALEPSPTLFLPTLSTSIGSLPPPPSRSSGSAPRAPVSEYSTDTDEDREPYEGDDDASSAPPSPTSLTSLPSYLASDVSLPGSPSIGYLSDPGSMGAQSPARSRSPGVGRLGSVAAALARARRGVPAHRRDTARPRSATGDGDGRLGEEAMDLVLPMLSLPSSSLHLSLRPYTGPAEAVKIALAGSSESVKAFLRLLGHREELVDVGIKGAVGVTRGDKLQLILLTGLSALQIRSKAITSYNALHSLLNPSSSTSDRSQVQLRDMVARYAEREDWVHGWVALDDLPPLDTAAVSKVIYPLPIVDIGDDVQAAAAGGSAPLPAAESAHLDEATPMPHTEGSSYFQQPLSARPSTSPIQESEASSETAEHISSIQAVLAALDSPDNLVMKSVDRFLAWRPAPLDSSDSSLGTTSAGTSGAAGLDREFPPMPTVARAQGGGEWEAGLSRRIAKRRETDTAAASGSGRTSSTKVSPTASGAAGSAPARRRRSKGNKDASASTAGAAGTGRSGDPHEPLFPPSSSAAARHRSSSTTRGLGVTELLSKTFAPIKKGLQGWRGMLVFAAVVGVVGFGWWIGKRA